MNYPSRIITMGDQDSSVVKQIQIKLNLLGCGPIAEDGIFGAKTLQAVKAFQQSHQDQNSNHLTVDGKVGPLTWTCLFDDPKPQKIPSSPLMAALLIIVRREIGVKEVPPGSNRGPRVEEYLKSVRLGPGYAWCAAFVYWCFEQASASLNRVNPLPRTGSCLDHWNKTKGEKITLQQTLNDPKLIEPGDVFIIRSKGIKGHTGIVVSISDGYIHTIEGNTNSFHSAEGDGVIELQRKIDSINVGFIKYC